MSNHRMPYRKHFCKDAQADPTYKGLPPYARAFLWDVIDAIHMNGHDGAITMTVPTLARYLGSTPEETLQSIAAIVEARTLDVFSDENEIGCRSNVSLLSRRMAREADERKAERNKKKRQRGGSVPNLSPECPEEVPSYILQIQIQSQSQIQIQSQRHGDTSTTEQLSSPPAQEVRPKVKKPPRTPDDWTPTERVIHRLKDKLLFGSYDACRKEVALLRQKGLSIEEIEKLVDDLAKEGDKPWHWKDAVLAKLNGTVKQDRFAFLNDPLPPRRGEPGYVPK